MTNWDHLFEWHLQMQSKNKIRLTPPQTEKFRVAVQEIKTDLAKLTMAYDQHGKLNLADVRPTGFLLKKRA